MVISQQTAEIAVASVATEHPTETSHLLEIILEEGNIQRALKRVCENKGAPGVDGMQVTQLPGYLKRHWLKIEKSVQSGTYSPFPVRGKLIPKPNGGERLLGIPTALDRLIQQAIAQVLQSIWDPTFSDFSFGFRPGRSQHDAVRMAKQYLLSGYKHTVDMDLSRFFDRVHHDRLMSRLATKIKDKRVLKLIRSFLTAGLFLGGLESPRFEGTPQGGPLSPLLSNIVLDELDKELESRGLRFVRYADDFLIFTKSRKSAERVMRSVSNYLSRKLRLKINQDKSRVTRPWFCKFLGFTFLDMCGNTKIRIHQESITRFKDRIREITNRNRGRSLWQVIEELNRYLRGWWNYYRLCETRYLFKSLNSWIIRRLRCLLWKQWKNPKTRVRNLLKRGIPLTYAMTCGNSRKKYWRMSKVKWVVIALPTPYFLSLGLFLPGK